MLPRAGEILAWAKISSSFDRNQDNLGNFNLTPSAAVSIESMRPMQARSVGLAEDADQPNSQIPNNDPRQPGESPGILVALLDVARGGGWSRFALTPVFRRLEK